MLRNVHFCWPNIFILFGIKGFQYCYNLLTNVSSTEPSLFFPHSADVRWWTQDVWGGRGEKVKRGTSCMRWGTIMIKGHLIKFFTYPVMFYQPQGHSGGRFCGVQTFGAPGGGKSPRVAFLYFHITVAHFYTEITALLFLCGRTDSNAPYLIERLSKWQYSQVQYSNHTIFLMKVKWCFVVL